MPELHGFATHSGTACGRALVIRSDVAACEPDESGSEPALEADRFARAREAVEADLDRRSDAVRGSAPVAADVLDAHIALLHDPQVLRDIRRRIASGASAGAAVHAAFSDAERVLEASGEASVRSRAADIRDIRDALASRLCGRKAPVRSDRGFDDVVVLRELRPSHLVGPGSARAVAYVSELGTPTCHAALLARSMGIPCVLGVRGACGSVPDGAWIRVDSDEGTVRLAGDGPAGAPAGSAPASRASAPQPPGPVPGSGADEPGAPDAKAGPGDRARNPRLLANAFCRDDARRARTCGAEGIGLVRSEFLFMTTGCGLDEEAQLDEYASLAAELGGTPVTVRTVDYAPDKPLAFLERAARTSGLTGIRLSLFERDALRVQFKALLRAAAHADVRIALPCVQSAAEVDEARRLLCSCADELERKGIPCRFDVPLGAVVESAEALVHIGALVRAADFVCIGSNDLAASVCGYERRCDSGGAERGCFDGRVLRAVSRISHAARDAGRGTCLCGALAGRADFLALWHALDIDALSMDPRDLEGCSRARAALAEREPAVPAGAYSAGSEEELLRILAANGLQAD